jgi:hypothetical protein
MKVLNLDNKASFNQSDNPNTANIHTTDTQEIQLLNNIDNFCFNIDCSIHKKRPK